MQTTATITILGIKLTSTALETSLATARSTAIHLVNPPTDPFLQAGPFMSLERRDTRSTRSTNEVTTVHITHPGQKRRRARGGPPDTEDYDSNGRASYNDFDEYDGSGFHTEYRGQSPGVKPNVQTSPQASHRTETLNGYGDTFSSEDTDWQGSLHDFRNHPGQKSRHNGSRSPDDDAYGPTGRGNDGGLYDSDFGGYEASNYDNNEYRAGGSRWMPGDQARPHAAERGYEYAGTEEQATGGNGAGQRNEAPPQPGRITYPGYEQRG
ncbi:hypothetical protein FFLO_01033 [Filobasidium floriforme]|uniref:Uncharacterized protein n=1 Tax=Filobasidium floriforme TaxID=5210 RepID=A0A8K0JRG2_9TREE|nr:uncharacterized protein HD553DRAFT_351501 [Filobasidium floriforme]KAG7571069.1 hypothetical protein FFLO_01033 [Filobasidium floriforme]KAH8081376.1 hypothetical protein HD553DRAFT_351501 [Filobasidium floriforme]